MPLPQPRKRERKDDFISRFMSNDNMKKEFKDVKQRYAVAINVWNRRNK